MANTVEVALDRIRQAILTKKVGIAELSRASGVPKTTICDIDGEDWNPRALTLIKLLDGLRKISGHSERAKD